jgi:hypothetical protein
VRHGHRYVDDGSLTNAMEYAMDDIAFEITWMVKRRTLREGV